MKLWLRSLLSGVVLFVCTSTAMAVTEDTLWDWIVRAAVWAAGGWHGF